MAGHPLHQTGLCRPSAQVSTKAGAFHLVHLVTRRLLRVLAGSSAVGALEVENAVLRHQLVVLRRRVRRPPLRRRDRLLLGAASALLPRERWSVLLVSPQ